MNIIKGVIGMGLVSLYGYLKTAQIGLWYLIPYALVCFILLYEGINGEDKKGADC